MNSLFNNKPFDEIGYDDIVQLVNQRLPESLFLDYKGDILQTGSLPKAKDFGKDVSAFANTFGGWIIYGIATDEKDEPKPIERDAIVGIKDQPALKESIESKILTSVAPKPYYRIKKINKPETDRCLILVYIPQSYNHVHMVISEKDNRFYKRYEYSSIPMDYYEIKKRFEDLGQTEKYRKKFITDTIEKLSNLVRDVSDNDLFCLVSYPKFPVYNYFNKIELIKKIQNQNRDNIIIKNGCPLQRRSNRFFIEYVKYNSQGKLEKRPTTINYFYNGIIIEIMPLVSDNNEIINASVLYYHIYNFCTLIQTYYTTFNSNGLIDVHCIYKGLKNKELNFNLKDIEYSMSKNFIFDEEIEPQQITIDTNEIINIVDLSESFIQPLFYGIDINVTLGLHDEKGKPLYYL